MHSVTEQDHKMTAIKVGFNKAMNADHQKPPSDPSTSELVQASLFDYCIDSYRTSSVSGVSLARALSLLSVRWLLTKVTA